MKRNGLILLAVLLALSLAACGAKKHPVQITVVNRTTLPIADLRISSALEEGWGGNRLEAALEEGDSVEIALGEYTKEQLDAGFQVQFYGGDGEPVDPDYIPDYPMFFGSGDFLILAPPDVGVSMFLDTGYDRETYDRKIAELYASDDATAEEVPVLTGGALPFSGMRNVRADNNPDGTYYYEDVTEDGQLAVVNTAEPCRFVPDVQEPGDYLAACALSLSGAVTYELLSVEENEEYSENLGCPVYIVMYTAGEGADARSWTVFAADDGRYTCLYGFRAAPETAADMEDVYQSVFVKLYLSRNE